MREIRTSGSMRGRRNRTSAQRACALLYRSPWLVSAAEIADLARGEPFSRSSSTVWGTRTLASPFAAPAEYVGVKHFH